MYKMDENADGLIVESEEMIIPALIDGKTLALNNLDQFCRLCSTSGDQLMAIFVGEGVEHKLLDKIREHLPMIEVDENDRLPSNICYACASTLISWHELYHSCKNADTQFRNMIDNLKSEPTITVDTENNDDNNFCSNDLPSKYDRCALQVTDTIPSEELLRTNTSFVEFGTSKCSKCNVNVGELIDGTLSCFSCLISEPNGDDVEENNEILGKSEPNWERYSPSVVLKCDKCDFECDSSIEVFEAHYTVHDDNVEEVLDTAPVASSSGYKKQPYRTRYQCTFCGKVFKSTNLLKTHEKRHLRSFSANNTFLFCELCKKYFKSKKGFAYHQRNICIQFKCYICDLSFAVESSLEDHLTTKHETEPNVPPISAAADTKSNNETTVVRACPICGKIVTQGVLSRHVQAHTNVKPFSCDLCGKQFKRKTLLQDHIMTEMGMKNYICHICGMKFLKQGYLNKHVKYHKLMEGEFQGFPCEQCDKRFPEKWRLGVHQRAVHKGGQYASVVCDVCGKSFAEQWMLKLHKRDDHKYEGLREYTCEFCDKKFLEKRMLRTHLRSSHFSGAKRTYCYSCNRSDHNTDDCPYKIPVVVDDSIKSNADVAPVNSFIECEFIDSTLAEYPSSWSHFEFETGDQPIRYNCGECDKLFTSKFSFQNHRFMHAKANAPSAYRCDFCEKDFASDEGLKNHLSLDKICLLCGKVYACIDQLKNHVFDEHNKDEEDEIKNFETEDRRSYECKLCGKKFARKQAMKTHLFAEMNLRRYSCEICDKSYNYYSHLNEHAIINHGEKEFLCGDCGKNFPTKKRFKDHMALHSEEKSFKCSCGQSFKLSRYLTKHKKHCKLIRDEQIEENICEEFDED